VVESIRLVNIFYKKRVSYFLAAFCLLFGILLCKLGMNYSREVHLAVDPLAVASSMFLAYLLQIPAFLPSAMPSQRGGKPLNQLVVDNFQQTIIPGRLATVQCRHCHKIMAYEATCQQIHLGTQEVNADKLMYIYINERTLNRSRELKKRLR